MNSILQKALMGVLVVLLVGACASDTDDNGAPGAENSGPATLKPIGKGCSLGTECASGTCTNAGVCSKKCKSHPDCGCPYGTTNGDINFGRCEVACVSGMCTTVCKSSVECGGTTTCDSTEGDIYKACL